jgi:hypothetical protein
MLIDGDDDLFGKGRKIHRFAFGGVFAGIEFQPPLKCAYCHVSFHAPRRSGI